MSSREAILNPPQEAEKRPRPADGEASERSRPGVARPEKQAGSARLKAISLAVRIVAGLLILAVGLAIAGLLVANRKQALQAPLEEVTRRVQAIELIPRPAGEVSRQWQGFGTARARDRADVAAEVPGRVVSRPVGVEAGTPVQAGDVLVRIEEADFRERLEAAQSAAAVLGAQIEGLDIDQGRLREQVEQSEEQIRLTRWELERLEEARAGAAATELETIRLRSALARQQGERLMLQQQLDGIPSRRAALLAEAAGRRNEAAVAERQLGRTTVVSPIDGVLQSLDANVGEMMQAGQRVARVVDLRRIEIPLRVPASAQGEIRIGDPATVRASNAGGGTGQGRSWGARIARIAPESDPQTRTITVFLEVEQEPPAATGSSSGWSDLLMPGRFVSAQLWAGSADGAAGATEGGEMRVLVPRRAVADDHIWVAVEDETGRTAAQPRQVRVLYNVEASFPELDTNETQWSVLSPENIATGERIIVSNLDELVPGVRVEVVGGRVNEEPIR